MRKRRVYALATGLAAVAAVALMLAFVVVPGGEGVKSSETSSGGRVASREIASTPGGQTEGIAVHGHWTIEVRNPDGSLVAQREFDNLLLNAGREKLVSILAREQVPGRWGIILGSDTVPPCKSGGENVSCISAETNEVGTGDELFKNLTVTKAGTGAMAKLVLSGSVTIANTTTINGVNTYLRLCGSTSSSVDCANASASSNALITGTGLSPTISVTAGQQVQVIVEISFS